MKSTIYVVAHKKVNLNLPREYKLIQVNAENNGQQDFADCWDNDGKDNISLKNPNFCELTALYWIWKHDKDSDVIGLTHYRRFFVTSKCHNKLLESYVYPFNKNIVDKLKVDNVENWLKEYDIILPQKYYSKETVRKAYFNAHKKNDFEVMEEVIKEKYPDYAQAFDTVANGYMEYGCNMLITSRKIFFDYTEWLMSILFEVEKRITISQDPYQARVFGFLSERLMAVYVYYNRLRVKELPIIFLDKNISNQNWKRKSGHTILADLGLLSWYHKNEE